MIIRTEKTRDYSILPNGILRDDRLSWKARGVAAYLLSMPDDWSISVAGLVNASVLDGRTNAENALRELAAAGYLVRRRVCDPVSGRFTWESVLHEKPVESTIHGDTVNGDSVNGSSVDSTIHGDTVNGDTVNGGAVINRSTIVLSTNYDHNDLSSDQLDSNASGASAPGVAGAPASVPSVVPLALQFRAVTDELRADGANRPAILRAWYVACFGEAGAPDYGRIGRVAKEIGGAGLLARRFLELAGCPPSGDVLSYIQAGAKRARVERNGGPAAAADWSVQAAQHPAPASPMAPIAQAAPAAIAGDPDLAAVLAADWADRVASVERAGEASPGVPLVRVVGRVAGDGWLKQKGSVAIRRLLTALVFGPGGVMVEVAA